MANKKTKMWIGIIPGAFGYGITVLECTKDEARKSLKKFYYAWKRSNNFNLTYAQAMDYFGGRIFEVETGKQYYDDFGS